MDKLIQILVFTVGFSLFDYFAYNISAKKGWTNGLLAPYRIVQGIVQIILIAIAWYFYGMVVAIGFTLLWWTWLADWIFHIFCYSNIYNDRQYVVKGEVAKKYWNNISWAWWTLFGLIKWLVTGRQQTVIQWWILAVQSLIGIIITVLT